MQQNDILLVNDWEVSAMEVGQAVRRQLWLLSFAPWWKTVHILLRNKTFLAIPLRNGIWDHTCQRIANAPTQDVSCRRCPQIECERRIVWNHVLNLLNYFLGIAWLGRAWWIVVHYFPWPTTTSIWLLLAREKQAQAPHGWCLYNIRRHSKMANHQSYMLVSVWVTSNFYHYTFYKKKCFGQSVCCCRLSFFCSFTKCV